MAQPDVTFLLHSMSVHVLFSTIVQCVLLPPVRKAVQHFEIFNVDRAFDFEPVLVVS